MKGLFLLCILFFPLLCSGQLGKDSVILMERAMDRPLTVHRGQFRMTGEYVLHVFTRRYLDDASFNTLGDEGIAQQESALGIRLQYGMTEFLQLQVGLRKIKGLTRDKDVYVIPSPDPVITLSSISEVRGLDDLDVSIDLRLPTRVTQYDVSLSLGAFLPLRSNVSSEPEHSVVVGDEATQVSYHYVNHPGSGVIRPFGRIQGKYRSEKWAFSSSVSWYHPVESTQHTHWGQQVYDGAFVYAAFPYEYQVPDELHVICQAEHQLFPWIDFIVACDYTRTYSGWSMQSGTKVDIPATQLVAIIGSVDVLITPRLWIQQRASLPLSGRNQMAGILIQTSLSYNFFP